MLIKPNGTNLNPIRGTLTQIHIDLGYIEIADDDIEYDINGNFLTHYKLNNGRYVSDTVARNVDKQIQDIKDVKTRVDKHVNDGAKEEGFFGMATVTNSMHSNGRRRARANKMMKWYENVWDFTEDELEKVKAGNRTMPAPDDFINELPIKG